MACFIVRACDSKRAEIFHGTFATEEVAARYLHYRQKNLNYGPEMAVFSADIEKTGETPDAVTVRAPIYYEGECGTVIGNYYVDLASPCEVEDASDDESSDEEYDGPEGSSSEDESTESFCDPPLGEEDTSDDESFESSDDDSESFVDSSDSE